MGHGLGFWGRGRSCRRCSWSPDSPRALLGHRVPGNHSYRRTCTVSRDHLQALDRWTKRFWIFGSVSDSQYLCGGSSHVGLSLLWKAIADNVRKRCPRRMGFSLSSPAYVWQETHSRNQAHILKPPSAFSLEEQAQGQTAGH